MSLTVTEKLEVYFGQREWVGFRYVEFEVHSALSQDLLFLCRCLHPASIPHEF